MPYPYDVLEIAENADQKQIRKAYLKKIREYPPEKYPEEFAQITQANELIKDQLSRARLKVFGMPDKNINTKFTELVVKNKKMRYKIGVDAWLNLLNGIRR